jgi:hypothetical protein
MKNSKLKSIFACCIFFLFIIITYSCKKSSNPSPAPTPICSTTGTSANLGGFHNSVNVGGNDYLTFSFINSSPFFSLGTGEISDAGSQTCLDFTYSITSNASDVPYSNGHGYVGTFTDGHTVKFIAGNYDTYHQTVNVSYTYK